MLIQEKINWDADVEKKLAHLATLGVDCVALDLTDPLPRDAGIDLLSKESATQFFSKAHGAIHIDVAVIDEDFLQAYRDVGFKSPFSLDHSPIFPERKPPIRRSRSVI